MAEGHLQTLRASNNYTTSNVLTRPSDGIEALPHAAHILRIGSVRAIQKVILRQGVIHQVQRALGCFFVTLREGLGLGVWT